MREREGREGKGRRKGERGRERGREGGKRGGGRERKVYTVIRLLQKQQSLQ